jgi:hypothetical protein
LLLSVLVCYSCRHILGDRAELDELKIWIEDSLADINENTDLNGLFKVLAKLRRDFGGNLRRDIVGGNYIFSVWMDQDSLHLVHGVRNAPLTLLVPSQRRATKEPKSKSPSNSEYRPFSAGSLVGPFVGESILLEII